MKSTDFLPQNSRNHELQPAISKDEIINRLLDDISRYKNLLQSVIHDLKYPIKSILELSALLEKDISKAEQQELLGVFRDWCNDATEKLNDLLTHEKDENLKFEPVSVNTLLKSCQSGIRGIAHAKQIQTCFTFLKKDKFIRIHRPAIKKALDNILSNAVKFSQAGGLIDVKAEIQENKLIISIADSGIGIPQDQQCCIFKKFNKKARLGTTGEQPTGLGLYLAKQSVLAHYGRLWFKSAENEGSVFYMELSLDRLTLESKD